MFTLDKLDKRSREGPYDVESFAGGACELSLEARAIDKATSALNEDAEELASSLIPRFETRSAKLGRRELARPLLRVQLDQPDGQ